MKRKKNSPAKEGRAKFGLPKHKQIEEDMQRELQFWQQSDRKGPYPLPVLDFIIGQIGCEIESAQDNEEFEKDVEYHNPSEYTTGITNGELYFSLYTTILKMTEEESFEFLELPLADQQAFASMLDLAITLFMDIHLDHELDQTAVDLWILYAWCRKSQKEPLWCNADFEPVEPPELERLTEDDWQDIAEYLTSHFLEDSDAQFIEMALLEEQPHWPTFQEFRKAKAWLLNWYDQIRWNSGKKTSN